jgi:hypothetical protein
MVGIFGAGKNRIYADRIAGLTTVSYVNGFDSPDKLMFPNRLLKTGLAAQIASTVDLNDERSGRTVDDIRKVIEKALTNRLFLVQSNVKTRLHKNEKVSIRRMMSSYWENSSIFCMNLEGAVIRQGTFVEKMHDIDWLHSPAVHSTMKRLIDKYQNFFTIMATFPRHVAVPTLDVDLAWHTHQLSPPSYRAYSIAKTKIFIDHDDKIEESALSSAFEWTSKTYQSTFHAVYSECTCWYCEA